MLSSELDYELPDERIAQRPTPARDGARMLELRRDGRLKHRQVREFCELVPAGALLVLNDSRVMKARLHARRASGGKVELLFLRPKQQSDELAEWEVLAKANKPLRPGTELFIEGRSELVVEVLSDGHEGAKWVRCSKPVHELMQRHGHVPLPPYIRRQDEAEDSQRYQTVFAQHSGSAAAPTAGLHLTSEALQRLQERGVELGYVTLHVGAGTFRPVTTETLEEHSMHEESFVVGEQLCEQVAEARRSGAPVVAVGTTVVRCLESAATESGALRAGAASTRLMITPGYQFLAVDALLTNFHAPRSTLLALVQAFAGASHVRAAYEAALGNGYRFLSYGDAMWIPERA